MVALRAAEQWSVMSLDELRECGLSGKAVWGRARKGWLHRLHEGVYAVGHPNPPFEGHMLAAVKACQPDAFLSHFAGSALWEFVRWDGRELEVTVRSAGTRIRPGIRVHRTSMLIPADVRRFRGIPVTSPARTLVDLASVVDYGTLRRAVRQAQSRKRVTFRELSEALARLRPRRGARNLARILASGPAPTRSELEDVVLDLMLRGGLARPDVNVPLLLDGRRVIPDFRWPAARLVVEADGAAWHGHRIAREDDAERQALLEAHGERVVRVTWDQAVSRPGETLARLRSAGAPSRHRASTQRP